MRAEAESNQGPSAYQPNALLLGQTGSPKWNAPALFHNAPPGAVQVFQSDLPNQQ